METKDQIFAAARAAFDRDGQDGLSLRDIAREVGITPMAIYRHYKDKQALVDALVLDGLAEWSARAEALPKDDPARWFEAMGEAYLDFALEKPRRFEAAFLTHTKVARRYPDDFLAGKSPAGVTARDDSRAVTKLIRDINAAAQKDKRRMLSIIVINTNVAATTLEQQTARSGLSLGDVYVAHALSLATRKKFDTIVALKAAGQSWSQIARAHKVSLKGSTELLKEMMRNS